MLVPALTSNIMQAKQAGLTKETVRSYWPACVGVMVGAGIGTNVLTGTDAATSKAIIGAVVVLFCLSQFLGALPPVSERARDWVTPLFGAISGFGGGLGGFFGLLLVPYLISLGLAKEAFVATIALLYLSGVAALYITLGLSQVITMEMVLVSTFCAVPTLAGVWLGSRVRRRVPEAVFRRVLLVVLALIALNLLRTPLNLCHGTFEA